MTAVAFVPPNVLPPPLQRFAGLLKRKWFRELVLAPPTISRRRFSNKTEDYGVFQPSLVQSIGQLSIYVRDIPRSRAWYEALAGLTAAGRRLSGAIVGKAIVEGRLRVEEGIAACAVSA